MPLYRPIIISYSRPPNTRSHVYILILLFGAYPQTFTIQSMVSVARLPTPGKVKFTFGNFAAGRPFRRPVPTNEPTRPKQVSPAKRSVGCHQPALRRSSPGGHTTSTCPAPGAGCRHLPARGKSELHFSPLFYAGRFPSPARAFAFTRAVRREWPVPAHSVAPLGRQMPAQTRPGPRPDLILIFIF